MKRLNMQDRTDRLRATLLLPALLLWAGLHAATAQTADLGLRLSTSPSLPAVGRPLTVTIALTNAGPGAASSVMVSNPLPAGVAFLSATSSVGTCTVIGGGVRCELGDMGVNQAASVTIALRPDFSGPLTNVATVWAAEADPNLVDNAAVSVVTISPPFIYIYSTNLYEGDAGTTNAIFQVALDAPSGETISVGYRTSGEQGQDGPATPGVDFLSVTGLLVFPPGLTSSFVSVTIVGDVLNEGNEAFSVQLFDPTNVLIAQRGYAWGTILNDDPLPVVSVTNVTLLEGDTGTTSAVFTVTLSAPSGRTTSVGCYTVAGTALAGSDYVSTNRTLVFSPGMTTQTMVVAVRGNTVLEGDEWFALRLDKPINYLTLGTSNAICTILDDDAVPGRLDHFRWSVVPSPQLLGIGFQGTVTALDAFNNPVTAYSGPVPLTAWASAVGATLLATPNALSNFVAGVWEGDIAVAQTNAAVVLRVDDGLEHVGDSNPFGVVAVPRLSVQFPVEANEGDGVITGVVAVATVLPRSQDLLVDVSVTGTNRAVTSPVLVIPAGATNALLSLEVLDDALLNGSQPVTLTVSASNCISAQASLVIHDNESTALAFVLPGSVPENAGAVAGLLRAARPPDTDVTVTLASSNTNSVRVPPNLVLPAGLTETSFVVTVVDNNRIDGARPVTLTAQVRHWTNASAVLTVLDDEPTNLVFQLPATVVEGQGTLAGAGRVTLGGTWSNALLVSLASSNAARITLPSTLTIPAGVTSAVFDLTVPENTVRDGTRPVLVTAQATGFAAGSNVVQVVDNDPASLTLEPIPSPQTSGVPFLVQIRTYDIDGLPAAEFQGTVALNGWGSSPWPVSPGTVGPFTNGGWSGLVSISGLEEMVTLSVQQAADLNLMSAPFLLKTPAVQLLNVKCEDLLYHPSNRMVYVSIAGSHWTSVSLLNPQDGRMQHWKAPYFYPGRLGLSGDGQMLYMDCPWSGGFETYRLSDGFECAGSYGQESLWGETVQYQGHDFETLAGGDDLMVASRYIYHNFGGWLLAGSRGVALFRRGAQLPDAFMMGAYTALGIFIDPPAPTRLTASSDGQTVFCTWPGVYARLAVTTNGLTPTQILSDRTVPAFGSGYGGELIWDRGWLYRENGDVIDPDRLQLVGRFPTNGLIRPDSALNRVFVLGRDGPYGTWRLSAYDQATFTLLESTNLSQVTGTPSSLIRCGSNTLAFRTSADQVFLLHGLLLPTEPPTDLAVSLQIASAPIGSGTNTTLTLWATNQGANPAAGVTLSARLPAALGPITVTSADGVCSASNGTVVCAVPLLVPGGSATLRFEVPTLVAGRFPCVGSVASRAQEPDYSNNLSQVSIEVPSLSEPRPRIANIATTGVETRLRFSTLGGERYRLERSSTLAPGSWSVVLDYIPGTGEPTEVTVHGPQTRPSGFTVSSPSRRDAGHVLP